MPKQFLEILGRFCTGFWGVLKLILSDFELSWG